MANAGCINAIGFDGSLIRTLQNLDSSNIGVGVQFTAPNPLDDKRLDYIKYTDKCGNTCCLTGENEILIYATNGTIKNLTLTNDDANEVVNVKRSDVFGSNRKKTVVRYKTGSYPTSITDGTLAVEELVQNQYASTGYNVSGLSDGTTYYFSVFAVAQDDTIIVVQTNSITPSFQFPIPTNTYAYYTLTANANDSSGHNRNLSAYSGITYSESNGAYLPNTTASTGMLSPFQITSSGTRTIIRRQKTLGIVQSDARGIDIYFNSSNRICSLWSNNQQGFYIKADIRKPYTETAGTRYNHIITISNGTVNLYIDNQLRYTGSISTGLTSTHFRRGEEYNHANYRQLYGYLKGIIVENKVYSEAERNKYRDKIKSQYGK